MSVKFEGEEIKGSSFTFDVFDSNLFDPARILYDAKIHGYSKATFHQKCKYITLKNGAKFGGYNPDNLSERGDYQCAPGAFVFSLTDGKGSAPQKFALKQELGGCAIMGYQARGPSFGAGSFIFFLIHPFLVERPLCSMSSWFARA